VKKCVLHFLRHGGGIKIITMPRHYAMRCWIAPLSDCPLPLVQRTRGWKKYGPPPKKNGKIRFPGGWRVGHGRGINTTRVEPQCSIKPWFQTKNVAYLGGVDRGEDRGEDQSINHPRKREIKITLKTDTNIQKKTRSQISIYYFSPK